MEKAGIAIISLVDKFKRESAKSGETYYLIHYELQKSLTANYFKLIGKEEGETLKNSKKPLFLFNNKKKFAYHLEEGKVYFVKYISRDKKFFHIEDWKILGSKLVVKRTFNLLLGSRKER